MELEYIGQESLNERSVHHVRLRNLREPEDAFNDLTADIDVYIDATTLLVTKLVYPIRPAVNLKLSEPVEVTYSDYRAASGLAIPFHVTYAVRGRVFREYRVTEFSVNRGAQDSDFEVR